MSAIVLEIQRPCKQHNTMNQGNYLNAYQKQKVLIGSACVSIIQTQTKICICFKFDHNISTTLVR